MKRLIVLVLLLGGAVSFAQPTSGDIIMLDPIKTETAESTPLKAVPTEREATIEQAQPSFEATIVSAFKAGNATIIATYFGENIDLSILGKANLYSKSQAQQILNHFFADHKPIDFKVIHKGTAKSSQYFIGELLAAKDKKYRVTINSKLEGNKKIITSLTIETN